MVSDLIGNLRELMGALVALAERYADLPMPGYTHLQRAQPITAGHHALAYVEMAHRDADRLRDALGRMDTCPLGSAALAGTAFPVDRQALADELGFRGGPTRNSLDAVSDRDHVCETLFCCSLIMLHLSRLAEDYIFFSSQEAGFLSFSDAVATGSSIMPQKKNPDAMELIRGKTGHVIGNLQAMLVTMKGLPLAYNKDMQEDKQALWSPLQAPGDCLRVAALVVRSASFREERCRAASEVGFLNATDLADLLVRDGLPFRDAHERVGKAVRLALEQGVELQDLASETRAELFGELGVDLHRELAVSEVLARRKTVGGTAPQRVRAEVEAWKKRLAGPD
jgi:argininosuccinate lyase